MLRYLVLVHSAIGLALCVVGITAAAVGIKFCLDLILGLSLSIAPLGASGWAIAAILTGIVLWYAPGGKD